MSSARGRIALAWLLIGFCGLALPSAKAGPQADEGLRESTLSGDAQQLLTDRRVLLQSQLLEGELDQERYSDAEEQLRLLSQSGPGMMVPLGTGAWEPVYRMSFRSFHRLPADLQTKLRRQMAELAETELQNAIRSGGHHSLLAVIRRFPGSDASCRAHFVLAQQHLDRGHRLAAMLWLSALTEAGVPDQWRIRAESIVKRLADAADQPFSAAESRLDHSLSGNGDSAVDSKNHSVVPKQTHWRYDVSLPPIAAEAIDRLVSSAQQLSVIPWTNWRPVVDDSGVYIRTLRGVTALSRSGGKPLWIWSAPGTLDTQLTIQSRSIEESAPPGAAADAIFNTLDRSPITTLLNRNAVIGRLTADNHRIYLIEDDQQARDVSTPAPFFLRSSSQPTVIPPVRLIALDKQTGRRLWTAGGEPVEDRYRNELTSTWIAGAPTVDGRSLFCVVEEPEAISLACLEAETGHLNWKTILTFPNNGIARETNRRVQAATPVVHEGIIWTNTTTGWLFAVDSLTQTVLWAVRTGKSDAAEDSRIVRGRMFTIAQPSSLRSTWMDHPPMLAGMRLIVFPHDSKQLLLIEALSGRPDRRINVAEHGVVLHADASRVIMAHSSSITAYSTADGSSLWTTRLPDDGIRPVGSGTLRGSNLLIAVSDGSIRAISVSDGQLVETQPNVVRAPVWGSLLAAGEDLISYSPSRTTLISASKPPFEDPGMLDQIERLTAAGQFSEALLLMDRMEPAEQSTDRLRQLKFHCLTMTLHADGSDSDQTLEQLRRMARTTAEQADIIRLTISSATASDRTSDGIRHILEALRQEAAIREHVIRRQPAPLLPAAALPPEAAFRLPDALADVQQPLEEWLLIRLAMLLNQADPQTISDALSDLETQPNEMLLRIPHASLTPLLVQRAAQRIEKSQLDEQTLHLLMQALALSRDNREESSNSQDSNRESIRRLLLEFQSQLTGADTADSPWTTIRLQMLNTLTESADPQVSSDRPGAAETLSESDQELFRQQIVQQWKTWPDEPYAMIPVTQSTVWRQPEQPLPLLDQHDPFLQQYEWQILRTAQFLKARSVGDESSGVWSISGAFPNSGPFGQNFDSIIRCGSMVIVQAGDAMSAFSVFDQRSVWNRRMSESQKYQFSLRNLNPLFSDYQVADRRKMSSAFASDFRVCGGTVRWTCLMSASRLEVVDNLTGRTKWFLNGPFDESFAFATEAGIALIDTKTSSSAVLHPADGSPLDTEMSDEQMQRVMAAAGEQLVVMRPVSRASEGIAFALDWIHPISAKVMRTQEFSGIRTLQMPDISTLVAMGSGSFQVINLGSGHVQHCTFESQSPDEAGSDDKQGDWIVLSDPINHYVIEQPRKYSAIPSRFVGRTLTPLAGSLYAVSRETGELRWKHHVATPTTATFDQPLSPVLLLIETNIAKMANPPARPGQPGSAGVSFSGILKTTGTPLFSHHLSARFPVPFVRLLTNHHHQVDVEAYGSRIRFFPPSQNAASAGTPQ